MTHNWAVIGAGPAGIAAVGKLLDHRVPASDIAWIDPHFTAGDFGTLWRNVISNTRVELFLKFLNACDAFEYKNCPIDFELNRAEKTKTCHLGLMADPLQWISDHLKNKVQAIYNTVENLHLKNRTWNIQLRDTTLTAKHVILANGAEAKSLPFPTPKNIPLSIAMDNAKLKENINSDDTVAVFGSSHSAVLVMRNLIENEVKQIINFYRSPLLYAVQMDNWILFDDTGLKGPTAEWAKNNIDGVLPSNLTRLYSNQKNIEYYLPSCTKTVYAVGFDRRTSPSITGLENVKYIKQAGIIAPGLFGFGIAFPEAKTNPLGMTEARVGLWKFMDYIQRILPIWLNYSP